MTRDSVIQRAKSWTNLQAVIQTLPAKAQGDVFERFVQLFLQISPRYASKLKHVWLYQQVPSTVREKLRLPAKDQGIDLIAQTREGEFWAIQCKYRGDEKSSLTWTELSTFTGLAFGVCKHISFALVCSTTERITQTLHRVSRVGFCSADVWRSLDPAFFQQVRERLSRRVLRPKPLRPRPHQSRAVHCAINHFLRDKQTRGKLIAPCGTGKSLAAFWIAKALKARTILVAVPSLALIRQTLNVWLKQTDAIGAHPHWICVCSDESVGRVERDENTVLSQDLGIPCETNSTSIAHWLKKRAGERLMVFTTYQSGEALAVAARKAGIVFDLGIMDEAHKTVGPVGKTFSHLIFDRNVKILRSRRIANFSGT